MHQFGDISNLLQVRQLAEQDLDLCARRRMRGIGQAILEARQVLGIGQFRPRKARRHVQRLAQYLARVRGR